MPHYATERRVGHAAEEMYALVADIERYPEFVPLCERLVVRARQTDGIRTVIVADMTVGYAALREAFTTRVTLDPGGLHVWAEYLEGPFRHLDSRWSFVPETGANACLVSFSIDYEFRSRLLAAVMGSAFDRMFRKFAEAFEKRADAIYGKTQ